MQVICFPEKEEKEDQKAVKIKLNRATIILNQVNNKIEGFKKEEEVDLKELKIE